MSTFSSSPPQESFVPSHPLPPYGTEEAASSPVTEDTAQKWERVAFGWCKVTTMLLLTAPLGKFALPVVALLTSALFVGAHVKGARESRCILKRPLLIAAFWGVIGVALLWWRVAKG